MKKNYSLFIISLIATFLFSVVCLASSDNNVYEGKIRDGIPEKMEEVSTDLNEAILRNPLFYITDNSIRLDAEVGTGESLVPISLSGKIFKSQQYKGAYTIKAIDDSNHFEVMNFQIIKKLLPEELLIPDNTRMTSTLLLYLKELSTGKVVLFELPLEDLQIDLFGEIEEDIIPGLSDPVEEHWWLNYFSPSSAAIIEPRAVGAATRVVTSYHGVYRYTMTIKLNVEAKNYPSSNISFGTSMASNLIVVSQTYYYNNTYQGNGDYLSIYNCIGEMALNGSKDYIFTGGFGSKSTETSGGFVASASFNISLGAFGMSIAWSPYETVTNLSGSFNFAGKNNSVNGVQIPLRQPLTAANDSYYINLDNVYRNSSGGGVRSVTAKYSFDVGYQGASGPRESFVMTATTNYQ